MQGLAAGLSALTLQGSIAAMLKDSFCEPSTRKVHLGNLHVKVTFSVRKSLLILLNFPTLCAPATVQWGGFLWHSRTKQLLVTESASGMGCGRVHKNFFSRLEMGFHFMSRTTTSSRGRTKAEPYERRLRKAYGAEALRGINCYFLPGSVTIESMVHELHEIPEAWPTS